MAAEATTGWLQRTSRAREHSYERCVCGKVRSFLGPSWEGLDSLLLSAAQVLSRLRLFSGVAAPLGSRFSPPVELPRSPSKPRSSGGPPSESDRLRALVCMCLHASSGTESCVSSMRHTGEGRYGRLRHAGRDPVNSVKSVRFHTSTSQDRPNRSKAALWDCLAATRPALQTVSASRAWCRLSCLPGALMAH
jgi:hypothetical protein